ncbi:MAG: acyl-CoA dehydrogenase C-terminal domain-containing protein [Burkholderiaceae bacterium]|jgi:alkylation response protein AidB-like acyl-CoA dehydrogenase|nr:acyl-CoA dehydrogenase C-terminal domain-containing protein [Burkholderiaceae bacterium]
MPQYHPPIREMQFVLHELLDVEAAYREMPRHAEINRALIDQVLVEGGKFCAEVLHPINRSGDEEGCTYVGDGVVRTPKGFKDAWVQFRDAGWPTLACEPDFGGQGMPAAVGIAFQEMMNSANQAFTMYPGLTHGAYDCLLAHGTPDQKALYLPRLVSGEWMGTMCLTEPHCGTDLGMLRSRAEPQADGTYKITGTKIFISAGEHDLVSNIAHLVLARLPDAPAGTRGISLFIVPKFLPAADGTLGGRNGVKAARIEEKMGIHASATCVLDFEGALGTLVGEPNKGLNAMFVMMNTARIGVGVQSLGLTEAAYQNAVVYARERLQSRSLTGPKAPDKPADPIIVHPDVRRMLLTQRAYLEGSRAFAYWLALHGDRAEHHPDEDERKASHDLLALLTPVVKAFLTDNGFLCTNLAMQVYGGHGYIRDAGMEQYVRDARINMIYEGTNTIQSLDLLGRKVLGDNGAKLRKFGALIKELVEEHGTRDDMAEFINPLADLGDKVEKLTMEIGMKAFGNPDEAGAAAVDYLRVIGHLVMGYFWVRMARIALDHPDDDFYKAKLAVARFYFARLMPETAGAIRSARAGSASLMALDAALF